MPSAKIQRFVVMVVESPRHTGRARRLHTVDLHLGPQALDGEGHTGNQSAAAHRHDHRIYVGKLIENLQPNRALPRDDQLIVIRMDEGHTGFLLQFHRPVVGIVVGAFDQFHFGPQPLGAFHLHNGGAVRHADYAVNPHPGGGQRHALRVVARRTGNHALGPLFLRELADLVVSPPDFETTRHLQVLGLKVKVGARAQPRRGNQIGFAGDLL